MRLLTEEEINEAYMGSDYHSTFKIGVAEIKHSIERVANAEHSKTLKAVGEWLEDRLIKARALDIYLDFKHTFLRGEGRQGEIRNQIHILNTH